MTQTRNVALALCALLVLSLFGVGRFLFWNTAGSTPAILSTAAVVESDATFAGTVAIPGEPERNSYITRMQAAVRERLGQFVPVVSESQTAATGSLTDANNETMSSTTDRAVVVQWCDATVLEAQFVSTWPQATVSVVETEGARMVTVTPTGATEPLTLMQFEVTPRKLTEPACLTHGYVGMSKEGRLIHNNDVILYQNRGADELIGYAFDGHPIYGVSTQVPDQCGGVAGQTEYRYQLATDRAFILGCFVSEPQQTLVIG